MTPQRDAGSSPGEEEAYAEHRAALEATVFRPVFPPDGETALVLELREGVLRRVGS